MKERLINHQQEPRWLNAVAKNLLALFALLLTPNLAWAQDNQVDIDDNDFMFYLDYSTQKYKIGSHSVNFFNDNKTYPDFYNLHGVSVTFSSDNTSVATIDPSTGVITPVGLGTTKITASFEGNPIYFQKETSYTLTFVDSRYGLFIGSHVGSGPFPAQAGVHASVTNASNITHTCIKSGKVSFDNNTRTLTLENATIDGCIYSYGDLTIDLKGANFITAPDSSAIKCTYAGVTASNITFKTTDGTGTLLAKPRTDACVNGFGTPTLQNDLQKLSGDYSDATLIGKQMFSGGTGTSSDPYIIGSVSDLKSFAIYFNNNLISTNVCAKIGDSVESLDCSGINDFEPIGDANNMFSGTFDGNNKKIENLSLLNIGGGYVGLFPYLDGGTVTQLILDGCSIGGGSGSYYIGGIVGNVFNNGTVSNCTVQNSTISSANNAQNPTVGGIVSYLESGTITECILQDSYVKAETELVGVSGPSAKAGGIAGQYSSDGSISNCQVKGTTEISARNVSGSNPLVAGAIFGYTTSTTLTLEGNTYESTVKTKTKEGDSDLIIKQNYEQRGIGSNNYDEPGALLAGTKKITVSDYDKTKGDLSLSENNEAYCVIERNASNKIIALYVFNSQNFAINASLMIDDNIKPRLTIKNGTDDIGMTVTDVENASHVYTHTEYAFKMPDADLTATLTFPIDIASATFAATIADGYYRGNPVVPTQMTLNDGNDDIILTTANNDFTITGYTLGGTAVDEPVDAGTYTVTVEGKNDYIGTRNVSYKIIQTYALKIAGTQVNENNATNVLGSAGTATVSFTPATATTPNTLTLNGATIDDNIESGLDELTIEFTGTNSLTGTSGYITSTNTNAALTLKGVTNGSNPSTLSLSNTIGVPAVGGFASVTLDGTYLKTDFASQYVPGNSPAIRNVKGGTMASATFTTTLYYPLWVYNEQVSGTNYTDVLGDGTVSYVHNDANNTGVLTLNGASISSSDAIEGFLNGLTIYLKGDNNLSTYTYEYSPISSGIGTAELTIAKHPDATGDVSLSLAYDGTAAPVISGFASVSYSGLNFISKTGATLDGATTYDAYLSSATIYPLWINGTIVTEANKSAILGAEDTSVTYDGDTNNGGTNTLTLNNYSYTGYGGSGHAIETNITGLKVKLVGASTINCTANSNYAFYTSQSTASIQFVKDNATSKLTLQTTPANPFGGFADGKVTYDGLVYYPTDKYIAVPTAPVMAEDNNKVKLTRDAYEGGTIAIKYSIDYADETADVTEATYSEPFAMAAPGTVTAWVEANNGNSSEVKGKYFGYQDAPFTLKADLDDPTKSETLMPVLIPALVDGENIGYKTTGAYESSADGVATFTGGTITAVGIGTATVTANLDYTSVQTVIILNPEKKVTAEVNVGMIPNITFADGMTYATFCNTSGKDLAVPDGLTAYAVTGTNETVVTLSEVGFLPKVDGTDYVALLLKREDTNATVGLALETTGGTRPTTNHLKYNNTGDKTTTGHEYVLYKDEFLKAKGTIPDGKCYLDLTGYGAARAVYSISHNDGDDTGISNVMINEDGAEKWYDLRGRRIEKPTKAGLYIRNGEKIVINDNK